MNSYSTSWWSLLLIYRPYEDEKLSWPCLLTYSGRFTHINGYPSAVGPVQTSESLPIRDRRSTIELHRYCITEYSSNLSIILGYPDTQRQTVETELKASAGMWSVSTVQKTHQQLVSLHYSTSNQLHRMIWYKKLQRALWYFRLVVMHKTWQKPQKLWTDTEGKKKLYPYLYWVNSFYRTTHMHS